MNRDLFLGRQRHVDDEDAFDGTLPIKKKSKSEKFAQHIKSPEFTSVLQPTERYDVWNISNTVFTPEVFFADVSPKVYDNYLNDYPPLACSYIDGFVRSDGKNDRYDTTFGITHDPVTNKWLPGKSEIIFDRNKKEFKTGNKAFKGANSAPLLFCFFQVVPTSECHIRILLIFILNKDLISAFRE